MAKNRISPSITNRESESLIRYFRDISRYPVLKVEEEAELARKSRAGDESAFNKLILCNLRFVISIAKQYQGYGVSLEDLIAEGNRGLLIAASRFDETRGFKFISYAVNWICQAMHKVITEHGRMVRLPQNKVLDLSTIRKVANLLEQKLFRIPTVSEVAAATDFPDYYVVELLQLDNHPISLDAPVGPDSETTIESVLVITSYESSDHGLMQESLKQELEMALDNLPEKEAQVLRLLFGLNVAYEYTLDEVGYVLGLSRERVRQLREKALKRLRNDGNLELLRSQLAA